MIYIKKDGVNKWRVNNYTFSDPQMGIRTISLSVSHPLDWVDGEPVEVPDFTKVYVEYEGEQYFIANSKPTAEKDTSDVSYKYSLTFKGSESDLERRKIRNLAETGVDKFISQGTSFSIYADISQFVQLLRNNLRYYFGNKWNIVLNASTSDSVLITANSMFIWDLLVKTYELYELRWYIRGNTIYIGREPDYIEHVFDYGVDGGLVKITRTAQSDRVANRLAGVGSSRNVPMNYFTNRHSGFPVDPNPISGDVNIKNIMPKVFRDSVKSGALPYIDYVEDANLVSSDGIKEDALEPNEAIFPSIAGVEVPGLGRIDQIIAVENVDADTPDDEGYSATFDVWVKDIQFDLKDDIYTSTEEAKISFTSGILSGYEFIILAQGGSRVVVEDTSKAYNGVQSKYKITLIKSSEEYEASGRMIPNSVVNASPNDSFVIYDIEMPQSYVELAEQRVQEWLESKLDELKKENPTYAIEPMDMFFEDETFETDGRTIKEKLKSGNKLSINNRKITDGVQELHINQVTIQYGGLLPKYTFVVTDKVNVGGSSIQRLQSSFDAIVNRQYYTEMELNELLNKVSKRYLSKISPDSAREVITFLKGIIANGISYFENLVASGKIAAKDIDVSDTLKTSILYSLVKAELQEVVLKGQISSEIFTSGFLGSGFRLNKIGDDWVLELDKVVVRKAMEIYELIVQKIRYQGGQVLHSPAGGKITNVTNGGNYWRVEHDSTDSFTTGAQVLCQNFKVGSEKDNPSGSTTFQGVSVKRYWRLVTSFGKGWFNLSKTDMEAGSAEPEIGDDIAVLGHKTDVNQQGAIMIASAGGNTPYIAYYSGINSYSLAGKEVVRNGNLAGIVDDVFGQLSGHGLYANVAYLKGRFSVISGNKEVLVPADKGAWVAGTYYYYDRVTHNGSLWLCIVASTNIEPSDNVPAIWQKQVGAGEDAIMYTLQPSVNMVKKESSGALNPTTLSCRLMKTEGSKVDVVSLPFGYSMDYLIDGTTLGSYLPGANISTTLFTEKIQFRLYNQVGGVVTVDQSTIFKVSDGGDAYNLSLSKSFHLFTGTATAATPESVQVEIMAYEGGERLIIPPSAIRINSGDLPTGMSYSKANNTATFTITSAMRTSGVIKIYITINGVEYTCYFSYSYSVNAAEINRIETETKSRFDVDEAKIQANVTAITSVTNNVTGLTSRVSAAESQLTVQAGQISSKVSYTEYNNNNIAINDQFSQIIQRADSIELSVNNIQVGGANLIDASNWEIGTIFEAAPAGSDYSACQGNNNTRIRSKELIRVGDKCVISLKNSSYYFIVLLFDANKKYLGQSTGYYTWRQATLFLSQTVEYVSVVLRLATNAVLTIGAYNTAKLQVERGNKETDWSASFNDIQVGGRNLLLGTGTPVISTAYPLKQYFVSPFEGGVLSNGNGYLIPGKQYTLSIDITASTNATNIQAYVSGGYTSIVNFVLTAKGRQTLKRTFTMPEYYAGRTPQNDPANANVAIYRAPNNSASETIHSIKIEAGSQATTYTQAPEDLTADLLATGINIVNKKITITANNTIFQNNAGQQVALFNASFTKIQAAAIELEGLVTVNSNFKVLLDGSIVANNGEFTGKISSNYDGNRIVIDASTRSLRFIRSNNELVTLMDFSDTGGYPKLVMYGSSRITSLSSQTLDMSNSSDSSNLVSINTTSFTVQKGNNMLTIGYSSGVLGNLLIDVRGLPTSTAVSGRVYLDSSGYLRVR